MGHLTEKERLRQLYPDDLTRTIISDLSRLKHKARMDILQAAVEYCENEIMTEIQAQQSDLKELLELKEQFRKMNSKPVVYDTVH